MQINNYMYLFKFYISHFTIFSQFSYLQHLQCTTKEIKVNDSQCKTGGNTKTIQLQRFSIHVQ